MIDDLYVYAENKGYEIYYMPIPASKGIALPGGAICLDQSFLFNGKTERTVLLHEIAHENREAFYPLTASSEEIRRAEYRAKKESWKIGLPYSDLLAAIRNGIRTTWELADFFGYEEQFIVSAIEYYKRQYGDFMTVN